MQDPVAPVDARAVRPARLADVPGIHALLGGFAQRGLLLSRSTGELYENVRDFGVVLRPDGSVLGCVALHICSRTLSELKSLAVADDAHGRGIGRALVDWCVAEAGALGLERVFCLTYQVAFFERQGFVRVDRSRLPEKVWGECVRCDRFLNCDEIALWTAAGLPTTG